MSSHKKDLLRKYAILLIAFMFSLLIPFLLYSLKINPLYGSNLSKPYEYPAMVKYSYSWPNTSSFNDSISSSDNVLQEKYKEIDQKYCGRDRCKFLLPVAITEQGIYIYTLIRLIRISSYKSYLYFRVKSPIPL